MKKIYNIDKKATILHLLFMHNKITNISSIIFYRREAWEVTIPSFCSLKMWSTLLQEKS